MIGYPSSQPGSGVKPIRSTFKDIEGQYRLRDEISYHPKMRKVFRPTGPTRISFVWTNDDVDEAGGRKGKGDATSSPVEYFAFNVGESMPLHRFIDEKEAEYSDKDASMTFRVPPTAQAFNPSTATRSSLDLAIGFESGDILVYEPLGKSYTSYFNREPRMNAGKVHDIAWLPNSKNLFVAAFGNGCLLVLDKEREDFPLPARTDASGEFCVIHSRQAKNNPVSKWYVSDKALTALSFSPDGTYLAVAGQDGYLRVFDFAEERLIVSFRSYFGGFRCLAWSPDGKCIATGGEDDLVTLFSVAERRVLARCAGHQSWVAAVAFDRFTGTMDPRFQTSYRFGSVGEDARVILWDYAHEAVRRPRVLSQAAPMSAGPPAGRPAQTTSPDDPRHRVATARTLAGVGRSLSSAAFILFVCVWFACLSRLRSA
eukprot:TRINITY_DN9571_c0_g1_i5.p1 TRINITY_DN9571_c0_g1~~TRINITY_DN9571_c0_g1_i5.p1  ORF type:complete len:427 (+),score=84.10 TRINITY_DN9571_c0_g1_i5:3-1283(+)